MKVIVRNSVSKKFWTTRGTWSRNPAKAKDFKSPVLALRGCMERGFYQFEVVVKGNGETGRLVDRGATS